MTLEEAIQHCEEVAYQKDLESGFETDNERYAMTDKERIDCKKCAKEHRQLAEWLKDYRRLLEQEPCEDCVSRQAVEDAIAEMNVNGESLGYAVAWDILSDLPSVTPQSKTRWIPVSERLPEDNKAYLVTVELTFARGERYVSQERKVNWDKMKECSHEIIAWMPLPKPYKAESEEK